MLQQLIERVGRDYQSLRENVQENLEDLRYKTGSVLSSAVDALEDTLFLLDDIQQAATQTIEGYRETREAMNGIRTGLDLYDLWSIGDIEMFKLESRRMYSTIEEELDRIKISSEVGTEDRTAQLPEIVGTLAYFVTHKADASLFSAAKTIYKLLEQQEE